MKIKELAFAVTETIVARTMNILENEYDIEELKNLGSPTITEIAEKIVDDAS